MKARDLIKASMRLIGVLASGEDATAAEAQDALASLNSMIDSWRTDRLMVYAVLPQQFQTVPSQTSYTLGPGGNWNVPRPERVDSMQLIYSQTGTPYPMTLPIELVDIDQYNAIVVPSTATSIPQKAYVDNNFPMRKVSLWPTPSEVQTIQVNTWALLTSIANLDTDIALPPGYELAMKYCLAILLAPEFGTEPSSTVVQTASSALANVKSANNTYMPLMQCDEAVLSHRHSGFNYLTGE